MAFDPFLYVAFGLGLLAGRVVRPKSPWVPRATLLSIVVLVGLLGASLNSVGGTALLLEIPVALGFAVAVLALTLGTYLVIARLRSVPAPAAGGASPDGRLPVSLALLAALVGGYALGHFVDLPTGVGIQWALYALLALVAFDLKLQRKGLENVWVPVSAAFVGALAAAGLFTVLVRVPLPSSLATATAFGFYSLAGPLVAARAGAVLGLLAFLTNFLREDLTMLLAPVLGRRVRGEGVAAMGGATAMDTTLYFVTRYGDPDAGSLAIATGLLLTVVATLVVPAALALPT